MKITIELPDDTLAMSITLLYDNEFSGLDMGNNMFGTNDLKNGAELTFRKPPKGVE